MAPRRRPGSTATPTSNDLREKQAINVRLTREIAEAVAATWDSNYREHTLGGVINELLRQALAAFPRETYMHAAYRKAHRFAQEYCAERVMVLLKTMQTELEQMDATRHVNEAEEDALAAFYAARDAGGVQTPTAPETSPEHAAGDFTRSG